jgi:hypothetical protein
MREVVDRFFLNWNFFFGKSSDGGVSFHYSFHSRNCLESCRRSNMLRWRLCRTLLGAIALYSQLDSLGGMAYAFQYPAAFPKSKLYQLSPQDMGLEDMAGTIAAFGDFNGDK